MSDLGALIVDLDGVIRHWDDEHFAETAAGFGVSARAFGGGAAKNGCHRDIPAHG